MPDNPRSVHPHPPARWVNGSAWLTEAMLEVASWGTRGLEYAGPARRALLRWMERRIRTAAMDANRQLRHPGAVEADKVAMQLAVMNLADKALAGHRLSDASMRGLLKLLLIDVLVKRGDQTAKARFIAKHGCGPPDFLVISPGKACNLRCVGCYADAGPSREKLEWEVFDRLVTEAHDAWGMRFFVLTGGEPLSYRSEGLGVLDLAERHPDCFFMMYTNGTLITEEVARRMSELGNISPAISLEGGRESTDARRGKGTFDRILAAMERLRRERVLFGVSLTATRENADEILSDKVIDLCFEELGALYGWVFHYMPIGRAYTLELMATPEQRMQLWHRLWKLVRERRLLIADFWNSGTATNGCVAGGRPGGYLHIDWNGHVSPCVFVPYSPVNLNEAFAAGKTLDDIWAEPFFGGIRDWQRDYGYRENGEKTGEFGNWLTPCLIRDHHGDFQHLMKCHSPQAVNEDAAAAQDDEAYHKGLEVFDCQLAELADPVWTEQYLSTVRKPRNRS